jgi:hypothetical protein
MLRVCAEYTDTYRHAMHALVRDGNHVRVRVRVRVRVDVSMQIAQARQQSCGLAGFCRERSG